MHTFFINTSKKELNGYDVLFDIHYENKTLVSMECPMSDWYDKEKGYNACVKQMSDMIDGYVELNNAFNLIIYIDLPEYKAYSSIQRDAFHDKERDECCRAMHILFTHVISESIVRELSDSGRRPQDVLIMFGEEKHFADYGVLADDPSRPGIMRRVFDFIGIPAADVIEETAKTVVKSDCDDRVSAFKESVFSKTTEELIYGIRDRYSENIALWCDDVICEANIPNANEALFDRILNVNKVETDRVGIEVVSCPYDCYASKVNKSILSLSELNIALYLLKCVESDSIFELKEDGKTKRLISFNAYTVKEIAPLLSAKRNIYAEKVSEVESLAKSYSELNLAPKLSNFAHSRFGLDEFGDKAIDLVISDVDQKEEDEKTKKEESDSEEKDNSDEDSETITIKGNNKEVTVVRKLGRTLFSEEEYQAFDYNYDDGSEQMHKKNISPEQYVKKALEVRKHHLDYIKKVKSHISRVLSNYAGKSKENKPALLQMGGARYATAGNETKVLEEVENVANKAYESMINQYMEFCAGRSVAMTDIEQQCNWFVSRINQIRDSLNRIKRVAIGLLIAIIALYLPFIIIQFEAIIKNGATIGIAACSIAIPIAVLYIIFTIITIAQKKKYIEAWDEFKQKSDQVLEENRLAVQKYDQLLSIIIPALRWVHEYKLDVDYCAECCSIADAKIEHHRRKLRERVSSIQNILSDLEFIESEVEDHKFDEIDVAEAVDYNTAFCSGEKNRGFYSVIDKAFLKKFKG